MLHAAALRWPLNRFDYVGVDPSLSMGFDLAESSEGENGNSLLPFQSDPYGCHSEVLQKKCRERNPFARTAPYVLTCPEMKHLLRSGADIEGSELWTCGSEAEQHGCEG